MLTFATCVDASTTGSDGSRPRATPVGSIARRVAASVDESFPALRVAVPMGRIGVATVRLAVPMGRIGVATVRLAVPTDRIGVATVRLAVPTTGLASRRRGSPVVVGRPRIERSPASDAVGLPLLAQKLLDVPAPAVPTEVFDGRRARRLHEVATDELGVGRLQRERPPATCAVELHGHVLGG
jgi:hypothetical protein